MNVRTAGLISPLLLLSLLTGCTGGHDSADHSSTAPRGLPTCLDTGDHAVLPTTLVSPMGTKWDGRITVLARTTPAHTTTVHALVTDRSHTHPEIPALVDSRIVLTRKIFEDVKKALGIPDPLIDPDHLLSGGNVVATSRHVRTTDLHNHELTLTVPIGLPPRDYFVVAVQSATPQCEPKRTGSTEGLIGLVRVLTPDGKVARLKPLPTQMHWHGI